MEKKISPSEVAKQLGVSIETIRRWLREGYLKGVKPGGPRGHWMISPNEVTRIKSEMEYYNAGQ